MVKAVISKTGVPTTCQARVSDYDDGDFDFEVDPRIRTSDEPADRERRGSDGSLDGAAARRRIPSRPAAPTPSTMRKKGSPLYGAQEQDEEEDESDSDSEAAAYIAEAARSNLGRRSVDNFFYQSNGSSAWRR